MRRSGLRMERIGGLLALLFLAGCLDLTEEIRLNGDGSGRLMIDLGVSEKVNALATLAGNKSPMPFNEEDLRKALEDSENIESFTISTRQSNGMAHTVLDAVVRDFTRPLPSLRRSGTAGQGTEEAVAPFTVRRLDNRNLRFVHKLSPLLAPEAGQATNLLAGLALSNRYLSVRLYGNIVSSNGTIAEDQRSVSWKIPLSQLLAGTTVINQLEAEVSPPAFAGLTTLLIAILIVATLAIGSVVLIRRRMR